MKKQKLKTAVKFVSIGLIILLALSFIIGYIWKILASSDYFLVKNIFIRGSDTADLSYLKGKNIFSLDLEKESGYILDNYPEYRRINLAKVLPDRIFADFNRRKPCAYIKLYKYFTVDSQGVIFSPSNQGRPQESELNLPVITGLETRLFGPKPGKKYNIKELSFALSLINEISRNSVLKNFRIKKIDVANLASSSVSLELNPAEVLELRLGNLNIREKILIVADLLIQESQELGNIRYIDLRFKQPVIKFKELKPKVKAKSNRL